MARVSVISGRNRQRGQNMLEYVGLVVIVAVAVAALAGSGWASTVTHRFTCGIRGVFADTGHVCPDKSKQGEQRRAGDRRSGDPARRPEAQTADPRGPAEGPAFVNGPNGKVPILPFPGEASVEGTAQTPGRPPITTSVTGSAVVGRSKSTLTVAEGLDGRRKLREQVRLELTTALEVETDVGLELSRIGVTLKHSMGGKSNYDVYVTPEQADKIANAKLPAPHPAKPQVIPVGTKIVLGKEYFRGHGIDGSYRTLWVESGVKQGRRASAGLVRLDKDHIKILVGRSDYIENLFSVGVGTDNFNISLGGSRKLGTGRARQLVIDISTNKGWRAYHAFLQTGKLPQWSQSTSYLSEVGYLQTETYSAHGGLQANAGPLHADIPLGRDVRARWVKTHYANGSYDYALSYRVDGITYVEQHRSKSGNVGTHNEYGVLLHDVAGSFLNIYRHSASKGEQRKVDAYVTFTEDQLRAMKERTYRAAAVRCQDHRFCASGAPTSVGGLKNYVRNHPHRLNVIFGPSGKTTALMKAAAKAKQPEDILASAHRISNGNPTKFLDLMTSFGMRTGKILAGEEAGQHDYQKYIPGDVVLRQPGG